MKKQYIPIGKNPVLRIFFIFFKFNIVSDLYFARKCSEIGGVTAGCWPTPLLLTTINFKGLIMANDSVTDESQTRQTSAQQDLQGRGNDSFVVFRETTFNLHFTHHDWLILCRLLATGRKMSQKVNSLLAHEWETLSEQLNSVLSRAGVRSGNESQKANHR